MGKSGDRDSSSSFQWFFVFIQFFLTAPSENLILKRMRGRRRGAEKNVLRRSRISITCFQVKVCTFCGVPKLLYNDEKAINMLICEEKKASAACCKCHKNYASQFKSFAAPQNTLNINLEAGLFLFRKLHLNCCFEVLQPFTAYWLAKNFFILENNIIEITVILESLSPK